MPTTSLGSSTGSPRRSPRIPWALLLLALVAAPPATAEEPALEQLRRAVEDEGMDLVRLQVQAVGPLRPGDLGTLTFPVGAPPGERTVLDYLPVMELESQGDEYEALLVVPLEVTGLVREARRSGAAFRLEPRLEPREHFERLFEYEGIHDGLRLPDPPPLPADRARVRPRPAWRGRVAGGPGRPVAEPTSSRAL